MSVDLPLRGLEESSLCSVSVVEVGDSVVPFSIQDDKVICSVYRSSQDLLCCR